MEHLSFLIKRIERYGLKKVVAWLLVLGFVGSLCIYTLPPVFEALGDILAFEIRDAHSRTYQ